MGLDILWELMEVAQNERLYQDLKQCILGEQLLPVQDDGKLIMSKTTSECFTSVNINNK